VHPASLRFGGIPLLEMLYGFKQASSQPVYIHLDHATDESDVRMVLEWGKADSIMVDGSAMPLSDNIGWTAAMASLAHRSGVVVEAELGRLAGEEVTTAQACAYANRQ
jgi:tagatose 1,6-diphosphate aldolase GatY/KbaY